MIPRLSEYISIKVLWRWEGWRGWLGTPVGWANAVQSSQTPMLKAVHLGSLQKLFNDIAQSRPIIMTEPAFTKSTHRGPTDSRTSFTRATLNACPLIVSYPPMFVEVNTLARRRILVSSLEPLITKHSGRWREIITETLNQAQYDFKAVSIASHPNSLTRPSHIFQMKGLCHSATPSLSATSGTTP